jgi:hypothetical protein
VIEAIVMEQGSFDFAGTSLREVSAALRMTMSVEWGQVEHLPAVMRAPTPIPQILLLIFSVCLCLSLRLFLQLRRGIALCELPQGTGVQQTELALCPAVKLW